jgi:hypothetical protein
MNKKIYVLLFVITSLGFSIISCKQLKNESSNVSSVQDVSPSEIVTQYFNNSSAGNESELDKLITRPPASYWVQCKAAGNSNQKAIEDDKQTEKKWADGYFEFTKTTSKHIKINNVKLLSIKEERILGAEAVVSAQAGNQFEKKDMIFYLTRENEKWKIFLVNSDNSDPVKFKFAEERPACN